MKINTTMILTTDRINKKVRKFIVKKYAKANKRILAIKIITFDFNNTEFLFKTSGILLKGTKRY